MTKRIFGRALILTIVFFMVTPLRAEVNDFVCGSLRNAYGPYDYRSDKDKLPIVENVHFTPEIATLVRGITGTVGAELDYTLRAFPNHHGALMSMIKLGERDKTSRPQGTKRTVECYLERAVRFRNDDATVKMIYATYLAKNKRNKEAIEQLNGAIDLGEDSANLQYNIGLIYLDIGKYDEALEHAHRAYNAGFPLPGLRDRLKRAGKWKELPPVIPEDVQASTPVVPPNQVE